MAIIYIGYYTSMCNFDKILCSNVQNLSVASHKFEENLILGIQLNNESFTKIYSYVPVNSSVKNSLSEVEQTSGVSIKQVYINKDSILETGTAIRKFKEELEADVSTDGEKVTILMYAVNPVMLMPVLSLQKKYKFRIYTICSEVPEMRRYGNSIRAKIKKKILTYFNEKFDGYIFFSEQMKNIVKCEHKPYIVVEGIAPDSAWDSLRNKRNVVMYAGGLASDNNVPLLIKACKRIKKLDEVWICGKGPDAEIIKAEATKDERIKYFGMISNAEVLELEKKAKVLINLRSPDIELTKYSFPSKILEYILSGTAVVSTRLSGIPEEYFDYIKYIDSVDIEELQSSIEAIFDMNSQDYYLFCKKAQDFVLSNKTAIHQAKRILDFCGNCK